MNFFSQNANSLAKKSGNILDSFKKAIKGYEQVNKEISLLKLEHTKKINELNNEVNALTAIHISNEKQKAKIESFLE